MVIELERDDLLVKDDVIRIIDTNFKSPDATRIRASEQIEKKNQEQISFLEASEFYSAQRLFWKQQRAKCFLYGFLTSFLIFSAVAGSYILNMLKDPTTHFEKKISAIEVSLKKHKLKRVAADDDKVLVFLSEKK